MKRRDFIKALTALSVAGSQMPLLAINRNRSLAKPTNTNWDSNRILILIKLNGGNDGLNTIIPIGDSRYYSARPKLAIAAEDAIVIDNDTALNPQMGDLKTLFDNNKMGVIQGVGYPNANLSHFRSGDIWATGSPANEYWQTGWLGRLFAMEYPNLPDGAPEHPIAVQMNSANILEFQTEETNVATMTFGADWMYWLIKENYIDDITGTQPDTYGGAELAYVRGLDVSTFEYSKVVYDAAVAGKNNENYPDTDLGNQLSTVAKLISGGLTTPVYRLYLHGFDTHSQQPDDQPPLLKQLSEAIGAFLKDIESQENIAEENIMIMTTSEFGRRVYENGSEGTDHGTSFPVMVIGSGVNAGFYGTNPDLSDLDADNNMKIQCDFRQIYSTFIDEWFGLSKQTAESVFQGSFTNIPFIKDPILSTENINTVPKSFKVAAAFPNPFNPVTTIKFTLPNESPVNINIFDTTGRIIEKINLGKFQSGTHLHKIDGSNWSSGIYIIQVEANSETLSQRVSLVK